MRSTAPVLRALAFAGVAAPLSLLAQDYDQSEWNHFGLDYRLGFNIQAKFSEHSNGYLDGFVHDDGSGNAGGQTWNWGYQNASQVSGNNLLLHGISYPGGGQNETDDPQQSFELSYVRDFDHESWGRWCIKASFGYTDISIKNSGPINGSLVTDSYSLGGIVAPVAPYSGSYGGPGPVISRTPGSSVSTPAVINGSRSVDASLFDFHLGPTVSVNLSQRLSFEAGGGLALGIVDSTFAFNETVPTGGGSASVAGGATDAGVQAGVYLEGGFAYRLTHSYSIYGGAEFEYLDSFDQGVDGHHVELDLSQSVFFVLGMQFHF
jgi:hypothetical protein